MKQSNIRKKIVEKMAEWKKNGSSYKFHQDLISGWHIDRMIDFIEELVNELRNQYKLEAKRTLILSMLSLGVENLTIKPKLDIDLFDVEMGFDDDGNRTCKLIKNL